MTLSSLPPECLHFILNILHDQSDKVSLCRLLQVNSYFCNATLPFLYGRLLTQSCSPKYRMVHPGLVTVIQTLLRQRPRDQVSELLSAAYNVLPETTTDSQADDEDLRRQSTSADNIGIGGRADDDEMPAVFSSGTDYLSYINAFSFEAVIYLSRDFIVQSSEKYPKRLAKYALSCDPEKKNEKERKVLSLVENVAGDTYGSGAHDDQLLFPPKVVAGGDKARWGKLRYRALSATLRRELTRTLCFPVLEQIQELIFPLSDLDRYLEVVDRFQSLISVTFVKDEMLEPTKSFSHLLDAEWAELEECKQKQHRQYRAMITFVQNYGRLFPNKLHSACLDVDKGICSYPNNIVQELDAALPPLVRPRSVDFSNWRRLANNIVATDLEFVKSMIISCPSTRDASATFLENDPTFLSRCRSLETIRMSSLGSGSFRWAVDEKLAWEQSMKECTKAIKEPGLQRLPLQPPPPLRRVSLTNWDAITDDVNETALAFGNTLTDLVFTSVPYPGFYRMEGASIPLGPLSEFWLGKGWKLPKIRLLTIQAPRLSLMVDPDLYVDGLGDALEQLELTDSSSKPFDCRLDLYICRPAVNPMPALTSILLTGWPALTFHPDTLHKVRNLRTLQLRSNYSQVRLYIPTMEELKSSIFFKRDLCATHANTEDDDNQDSRVHHSSHLSMTDCRGQPLWTWDWYLPRLDLLRLDAVFAYLFQFRMLARCPSLRHLELNISTLDPNSHCRTLTLQEFVHPNSSVKGQNGNGEEPQLIDASSIRNILLYGVWVIKDELKETILRKTFRGIKTLERPFMEVERVLVGS